MIKPGKRIMTVSVWEVKDKKGKFHEAKTVEKYEGFDEVRIYHDRIVAIKYHYGAVNREKKEEKIAEIKGEVEHVIVNLEDTNLVLVRLKDGRLISVVRQLIFGDKDEDVDNKV